MLLNPDSMYKDRHTVVPPAPAQKTGYLDIKQHSTVRPRKLKTWRRRWAVLTQMTNLSSDAFVAKLDLYDNETKWHSNSVDKITFVLENVTEVQQTTSSTHRYAFEVVEERPVLVMGGSCLEETCSWMLILQQIFMPDQVLASKGDYKVTMFEDKDTIKWGLSGKLILSVSPICISLAHPGGRGIASWALNTLKRFRVEKSPITGQKSLLVIETGPNSPTGQGCIRFHSDDTHHIMSAIKQSVYMAAALKEQTRDIVHRRSRRLTNPKGQRVIGFLFDDHPDLPSPARNRSDSESSSSKISPKCPLVKHDILNSSPARNLHPEEKLRSGIGETACVREKYIYKDGCTCEGLITHEDSVLKETCRSFRGTENRNGIEGSVAEYSLESDNHPKTSESPAVNVRRLRSISTVVAAIKAGSALEPSRLEQPDNDTTTDVDSAIASMVSAPNDDLLWMDLQYWRDFHVNDSKPREITDFMIPQKQLAVGDIFENEYEELDELSAALQKIHKEGDPESPPALPARPPSIICSSCNIHNKNSGGKTRTGNLKSNETTIRITSHLRDLNVGKSSASSGHDLCDVCRGDRSNRKSQYSLGKSPITEHLILDSCLCVDGTSVLDPEAARYSPTATLSQSSYSFDKLTKDRVSKTTHVQLHGRDEQAQVGCKQHVHNLPDTRETPATKEKTTPTIISNAINNYPSDKRLSFFQDNATGANPFAAGELTTSRTFFSSNFCISTPKPISASTLTDNTLTLSPLKSQNITNSEVQLRDKGFSIFNPLGTARMENKNDVFHLKISFASDQRICNQNGRQLISLSTNVTQNIHNDYIVMTANSDGWNSKASNCVNGMGGTVPIFTGQCVQDAYVQPNPTPSIVKQSQQFRRVY